jgi:hypothetical protein
MFALGIGFKSYMSRAPPMIGHFSSKELPPEAVIP